MSTTDSADSSSTTVKSGDEGGECGCILESLLGETSFEKMSQQQKRDAVAGGRPVPRLPSLFMETKRCVRRFRQANYESTSWLTGCRKTARLYCWPCVLFSKETSVWTSQGVNDLNNLTNLLKRHELSPPHIKARLKLKWFSERKPQSKLREALRSDNQKNNKIVKENVYILTRVINAVCFLAEQCIPFQETSENPCSGNYAQLIELLRSVNDKMDSFMNSSLFPVLSVREPIIVAVTEYVLEKIRTEIDESSFVSLMIDEVFTNKESRTISTVLRYVTLHGEVVERFLGFSSFTKDRSPSSISKHIYNTVNDYRCEKKLIAESYDGAIVTIEEHNNIQSDIKTFYNHAIFVHSYLQQLNFILRQSLSTIEECQVFFATLEEIASFFKLSQKNKMLEVEMYKRFPSVNTTRWDQNGRLVDTVCEFKEDLVKLWEHIIEQHHLWEPNIYLKAKGLRTAMLEFNFNFLLLTFSQIFPLSDSLFETLQLKYFNTSDSIKSIEQFQQFLDDFRIHFEQIWTQTEYFYDKLNGRIVDSKRRKNDLTDEKKNTHQCLYYQIIDTITINLAQRFSDIGRFYFVALLDKGMYDTYKNSFPHWLFDSLQTTYGEFFDLPRLKSELTVVYSTPEFHKNSILELHRYLKSTDLGQILPELLGLTTLILTIPVTGSIGQTNKSPPAFYRIKDYLNKTDLHISNLALLAVEKDLIRELKKTDSFYFSIINKFSELCPTIDIKCG